MLSFVTPLWLSGLALLPVVRWLHRGGLHRRAVPVSRLELWEGSSSSPPAAGERRPPDPAWRRRALLTALLFVALAEPQLPQQRTRITLWVDDSLSMLTQEAQGTRLAQGLAQARALLAEVAHADVEVRTLGEPWRGLGALTDAAAARLSAGAGTKVANAPPEGLLRRDRLHWLLTDGAHAALFAWPGGTHPDRVIQVGKVTRNAGLERLSARRSLADAASFELLLKVTNGGTAAETRDIVFATDAGEVTRSTLQLAPGTSGFVAASVPASATVRATLEPGDALAEDDQIVLDLTPLRRHRVATDAKCPAALVAEVRAHPALDLAPANADDVQAALDCGTRPASSAVATLRVLAERTPAQPSGPLQWSSTVPESGRVRLDTEGLRVAAQLRPGAADRTLLAAGDAPLIVSRAGASKLIETSLDFGSPQMTHGPQVPLLVNLMFEQLLGKPLLDQVAVTDRGSGAAQVAPLPRADANMGTRAPDDARLRRDWTVPVLWVALLALLWESVALARQWVLLRQYAGAASG